ncbi:hypothetical protein [Deinococcus aerophilus]|uniref:Uncharacterized protein n=1 Tax=Deinococcus aerophilus TaxID=522488 RepID=A0ABQ2GXG9_9DEIO|nr:hypothetical protein [Deinococcus aerophilus]GGM16908.1 hypothetical protein GCM10010841_26510 [Deinococcus aerophilus]
MTPNPSARALTPQEHLRQLHHVYGPLSPAFVAEELRCTLEDAARHLYGPHAGRYCWVGLADLAQLSGVGMTALKRWVRRHHLQSAALKGQGRSANAYIHLDDARTFLSRQMVLAGQEGAADALLRVTGEDLGPAPIARAAAVDVDWQLARQAAWPMTVDRLAEAVYGSRAGHAQQQTRKTLRVWEAQGRVVCFARGLYDLVRPSVVLDPGRYRRSALPKEDLQNLRAHHSELAHWSDGSLAAAWRSYSAFYAHTLLPVMDREEPTLLEYLTVRQLNPDWVPEDVDTRYEELCREAAFYRVLSAPPQSVLKTHQPVLSAENIEAGVIDFKPAAEATRLKMQRHSGRDHRPSVSGRMQERA